MTHPVRQYREKEGLTQAQLAKKLRVSRAMVGLVETGDRDIDPAEVAHWEAITGIPREKLRPDIFEAAA